MNIEFSDLLRISLLQLKKTQKELSYQLEVSPTTVHFWLEGFAPQSRYLKKYKKFLKILGVEKPDFLVKPKREEKKNRKPPTSGSYRLEVSKVLKG